jgi:antitoxin (DNA-binding transcriptional repressor) of toxin-antitoxin stability system
MVLLSSAAAKPAVVHLWGTQGKSCRSRPASRLPVRASPGQAAARTAASLSGSGLLAAGSGDVADTEGRNQIMSITATELKSNLGKYLLLAATEDIFITRNGKVVAKLSNPHQDRVDIAKSLFGILPADVTLEEAKEERLNRI